MTHYNDAVRKATRVIDSCQTKTQVCNAQRYVTNLINLFGGTALTLNNRINNKLIELS